MSITTIFIIIYIVSVILSNLVTILYYKDEVRQGKFIRTETPTLGHFMEYYGFVCIINFVPVVNSVTILFLGGYLLWNKIKNVKL